MNPRIVHNLACPDSGCGDIRITYHDLRLLLDYEFRAGGQDQVGHVEFSNVVAFMFRDELHSAGFVHGSYDQVVEIGDSSWLEELRAGEPSGFGGLSGTHHFAVLVSSNGYLEVLAEGFVAQADTVGVLEEPGVAKR
jgi:hypothetical protein